MAKKKKNQKSNASNREESKEDLERNEILDEIEKELASKKSLSSENKVKIIRVRGENDKKVFDKIFKDAKSNGIIKNVLTVMIILLILACIFFFCLRSFPSGFINNSSSATVAVPCPIKSAKAVEANNVHYRVLNGTGRQGYADAVNKSLKQRSFSSMGIGTISTLTDETKIYFGKNAVNEAYTLALHFKNYVMVMDDRDDFLVDIVIGKDFDNLIDISNVDPSATLVGTSSCIPVSSFSNLPKAIEHEPYYDYTTQDPNREEAVKETTSKN